MSIIDHQVDDNGTSVPIQNKVTSLFGFGGTATIDVIPNPTDRKKFFTSKTEGKTPVKLPIYSGEDDISGVVNVKLQDTKKF